MRVRAGFRPELRRRLHRRRPAREDRPRAALAHRQLGLRVRFGVHHLGELRRGELLGRRVLRSRPFVVSRGRLARIRAADDGNEDTRGCGQRHDQDRVELGEDRPYRNEHDERGSDRQTHRRGVPGAQRLASLGFATLFQRGRDRLGVGHLVGLPRWLLLLHDGPLSDDPWEARPFGPDGQLEKANEEPGNRHHDDDHRRAELGEPGADRNRDQEAGFEREPRPKSSLHCRDRLLRRGAVFVIYADSVGVLHAGP